MALLRQLRSFTSASWKLPAFPGNLDVLSVDIFTNTISHIAADKFFSNGFDISWLARPGRCALLKAQSFASPPACFEAATSYAFR